MSLLSPYKSCSSLEYELCEGGGLPGVYAKEWSTLLRHSPWLWLVVISRERWILANQIRATGWSQRQWICTQLISILFYCQIRMTVSANITKRLLQTTALTVCLILWSVIWLYGRLGRLLLSLCCCSLYLTHHTVIITHSTIQCSFRWSKTPNKDSWTKFMHVS